VSDDYGNLIHKPWVIAASEEVFGSDMARHRCDGKRGHLICGGQLANKSE